MGLVNPMSESTHAFETLCITVPLVASADCGTRSPPGGTKRRAPERKELHKKGEGSYKNSVHTKYKDN